MSADGYDSPLAARNLDAAARMAILYAMSKLFYALWVTLLLSALPAAAQAAPTEQIIKLVRDAQAAGWVMHDLAGYMAQWTKDAKVVIGRGPRPGRYDVVLTRARLRASRALRFGVPAGLGKYFKFQGAKVTVKGQRATLRVEVTHGYPGGNERVAELYKLRRTKAGWRVYLNRAWPLSARRGEQTLTFGPALYRKLDALALKARGRRDLRQMSRLLLQGYRLTEAYGVAQKVTLSPGATADDWAWRGLTATYVGHTDDAKSCFARARKLDPRGVLPPFAR